MNSPQTRIVFRDETSVPGSHKAPWRILVVDDDPEVHQATRFALENLDVAGRPLALLHAYSGSEALGVLASEPDIAVILLDVVMETPTAGLDMIAHIRNHLKLGNTRIILRTGQPGYAPEIETIRQYEINDYKSKGELTQTRLFAALSVALRTYDQLCTEARAREDLQRILESGRQLRALRGQVGDAGVLLEQLAAYWGSSPDGMIAAGDRSASNFTLAAGRGRYAGHIGEQLQAAADGTVQSAIQRCLRERRSVMTDEGVALYLRQDDEGTMAGFIHLDERERERRPSRMLDMFCAHLALEWQNETLLERLRKAAYLDSLTGLLNRAAMVQKLEAIEDLTGTAPDFNLAMIDIDQFSGINDLFGHVYGDRLLQRAGARLRAALPGSTVVARVGSDAFAIWGPTEQVQPAALRQHFSVPFVFDEIEHTVSVSIGMVRLGDAPGVLGADLLKEASIALKRAKLNGHGQDAWYTASSARETREHTRMLHALRAAFQREQLFLVFQPQVSLQTGMATGVEALLRWRNDEGEFIAPDRFLPLAERSGLIIELGAWVLRSALRVARMFALRGLDIRMAVNVSAQQFSHPNFYSTVESVLRDEQVAPERVELELTESVAVLGAEMVEDLLQRLRGLGLTVAIDDFGTGYSSLSYLDRLPVDRIKIDRSFVKVLNTRTRGARIAELVVPLGQHLGLSVVAEGVETAAQAEYLRGLGCDEAQGYFYARPMPVDQLMEWLNTRAASAPGA